MRIILAILITSIIATTLIKIAEHYFGMVNVFMFSFAVVAIMGGVVVPCLQYKQHRMKKQRVS
jgi:hypothetical protein